MSLIGLEMHRLYRIVCQYCFRGELVNDAGPGAGWSSA